MPTSDLSPAQAAHWAARAGLPLPPDRHAAVAATARHIHSVVATLRELEFGDVPPALTYQAELAYQAELTHQAEQDQHDAAV
ncbi:hypothetical protein ABZ832_14900 [Streptantibioticus parmotrematis]|uniref:hypothetical protein n=1 Tax=Streptantibioticus parmotrematis TaxID=2873249 RepID=UPI00340EC03F